MNLRAIDGWQRLIVLLSIMWLACVTLFCFSGALAPRLNSWLFVPTVSLTDPLGLFPKLVWFRLLALVVFPLLWLWATGFLASWVYKGFSERESSLLLIAGRLQDVLALIQVLALDRHTHRSATGLLSELQGPPKSAVSWSVVAASHPEFFRNQPELENGVSLVARHVLPKNENGIRELSVDFAGKLLSLAVELHDRQLRRARAWEIFVPVIVALVAGAIGLFGLAFKP